MAGLTKAEARRARQLEQLIEAAARIIERDGFAALRARTLATEVGCALGAIYNLVADLDEIIIRVNSRTLARLQNAMNSVDAKASGADPVDQLVALARTYARFARDHTPAWRALFEHRMAPGKVLPDFAVADQMRLFEHILEPVKRLMPEASDGEIALTARTLFASVHGIITLDLDEKLLAVSRESLDRQIELAVRWMSDGIRQKPPVGAAKTSRSAGKSR